MKENQNYCIRFKQQPEYSFVLNIFYTLFLVILPLGIYETQKYLICVYIFVIALCIQIILFIYSLIFGWNTVLYFDNEKTWQKKGKKIYTWFYSDIYQVKIRKPFWLKISPVVFISERNNKRKLKFQINDYRLNTIKRLILNKKFLKEIEISYKKYYSISL